MMFRPLVLCMVVITVVQATTQYANVDFIENVIEKENKAAPTDSRIVSGWEAYPGQHPHQAMLRMISPVGEVSSCGGSFVHQEWVITAAHCTAGRITIVVRVGATNITTPAYIAESTLWYNHPTYNDNLPSLVQPNDISALKLPRPLVYNHLVQPIRLQSSVDSNRDYSGQVVYASGYGRLWTAGSLPEVLNWVYLRGVSNAACFSTFGSIITSTTICAQFYNVTSQSTCQGDSGGPLVHVNSEGVPVLIGVTSFVAGGDFGCHSGLPAGFIRPGPFHGWLRDVTGIDFEKLDEETTIIVPTSEGIDETTISATTEGIDETTFAPTTTNKPDSEEDNKDSQETEENEEDSSSSEEDPELSDLLKKLEVKVKVKVKLNKYLKKHHKVTKSF